MRIEGLSGLFNGKEFHKGPLTVEIEDGKISKIIKNDSKTTNDAISGKGMIASHGFNDAHTHAIFGGDRFFELSLKLKGLSYSQILSQGGGIKKTVHATRQASDSELKESLRGRLDVMLSHGSLMVEVKTGYGLTTYDEIRQLRIINELNKEHPVEVVPTFGAAHVVPPEKTREEYINEILDDMLPVIAKEKLATTTDVFCDKGAFTVEEAETIFQRSISLGIPIRVHAEELEYTGIGKIAAEKYNSLSADHLLLANREDFEVLGRTGTVATFMPLAPIGLFTDNKPKDWKDTGATIALGSDFNPNNWIVSMQTAIRMAVFTYKMKPLSAFQAATMGSYKSITGLEFGLLEEGHSADLILIQGSGLDEISAKIGQNLVKYVIKGGELISKNTHISV